MREKKAIAKNASAIRVPDELAEYIDFYRTDEPFTYRLELHTSTKAILALSFSKLFQDIGQAQWAFQTIVAVAIQLGITDAHDLRYSIRLSRRGDKLNFVFCDWLVLQFVRKQDQLLLLFPLLDELAAIDALFCDFRYACKPDEHQISLYALPVETYLTLADKLKGPIAQTMDNIKKRFAQYKRSRYRRSHMETLGKAIFEQDSLTTVLKDGLKQSDIDQTIGVWWVNQGSSQQAEQAEGVLWSPQKSSDGKSLYHWDTMTELQEDDIVLHYSNGALRYVSRVLVPAVESQQPQALKNSYHDRPGYLVKVEYYELQPAIPLKMVTAALQTLDIQQGPFDSNGGVKQGYLFRFDEKALQRIQQTHLATNWPEFTQLDREEAVKYWIFKSNPQYYKAVDALRDQAVHNWRVPTHQQAIKKGDKVILWITGAEAGCYALATVNSDVDWIKDKVSPYWVNKTKEHEEYTGCDLLIDYSLVDCPILQTQITDNENLTNLHIGQQGRIFSATAQEYMELERLAQEQLVQCSAMPERICNEAYSMDQFVAETYLDAIEATRWLRAIRRKGQVVLYGPPGTGKTYVAERLAKLLLSEGDGFSELVQFHPAYSYEDFMQGIRPTTQDDGSIGYSLMPGRFLDFCQRAMMCEGTCVFIIDEINRANLARVFGELMFLLEYRNQQIPLAGGGLFSIPNNVFIIGTMNTADRSIALVDHALRRRFAFLALQPNLDVLEQFHQDTGFNSKGLLSVIRNINQQIADKHYEIGISFFMCEDLTEQIEDVWTMEIEPYLEEYFCDQPDKIHEFRWEQIKSKVFL